MYNLKPYLDTIEEVIAKGPFCNSWESLTAYRVPEWYQKAKFGIFIHWGVYSVPAYDNEWYSRNMYIQGSKAYEHHIETYGRQKDFGYKDFIPLFQAKQFDPEKWLDLFHKAGARYVVPVAEHHDGFQMYKSELSKWNAYEMGPKRDILGELKQSCDRRGITLGASSHRVEHWFFMGHGRDFDSDVKEPMERGDFYWPAMPEAEHMDINSEPVPTEEFLQDWMVRTCEIIDRYRPALLYFDWWIQHSAVKPYLQKIAAYYYNRGAEWGMEVAINYKLDAFAFGSAVPDIERGKFADVKPFFWQTDTAVALNSWCHTQNNTYKTASGLICDLVDIVSKNGCLLLNIGPKSDGTITAEEEQILLDMGSWLRVNGEAVYETGVWRKSGEGPTQSAEGQFSDGIKTEYTSEDFRFTCAKGYLYAAVLKASHDGHYCIRSLKMQEGKEKVDYSGSIYDVETLGEIKKPEWKRDREGLKITCRLKSEYPIVFKIKLG